MRCRRSWSLSTLGSKHTCDKNRRSSVTYASISVFPPHPIPSPRTTKYVVCCCCPHIKSRSDLYSVPSNIRIGPTDANAFRGHRLTTQKGYKYATYKTRNIFLKKLMDRKADSYAYEKLIRKWTKSGVFFRDQKHERRPSYAYGFGLLFFRQTRTGLPMWVRYSNEIAEWKCPPIFQNKRVRYARKSRQAGPLQ